MRLDLFGYHMHLTKDTRLDDLAQTVTTQYAVLNAKLEQLLSAKQAEIDAVTHMLTILRARLADARHVLSPHAPSQES